MKVISLFLVRGLAALCLLFTSHCALGTETDAAETASSASPVCRDIAFASADAVPLFGRLVLPTTNSPRAVVVYVQTAEGATIDMRRPLGTGRTFNYYDLYREQFTARQIGFFSYEGRGIRMGTEPPRYEQIDWPIFNTGTLQNKVNDLLAAVHAVHAQPGLGDTPIFLIGASEGTLLAAEAAALEPDAIDGLVLYGVLAANLRKTFAYIMGEGEFLRYRPLDADRDGVITREEWDALVKTTPFAQADLNGDDQFTVADVRVATALYLEAIETEDFAVLQGWAKRAAAVAVPENWFADHFAHAEIWSFLSQLDIPVGCFHGELDRMAPVSALRKLETRANESDRKKMEFHYFPDGDHSLQVGTYFGGGELPAGHRAIFEFIDRIAP